MKIKVNKEKCSGCHLCEMVCSLFHHGAINIEKSAIRVEKDDLCTSLNSPVLCRQCGRMACLAEEHVVAKHEKRKFVWDGVRAGRCTFNALSLFENTAFHCDLCGGDPQCVKVCTPGALTLHK